MHDRNAVSARTGLHFEQVLVGRFAAHAARVRFVAVPAPPAPQKPLIQSRANGAHRLVGRSPAAFSVRAALWHGDDGNEE